jgi:ATP phosphoribosyltransferase
MQPAYTLALPSKGELAEPTDQFLKDAGLRVHRPNQRQYTGTIPALPDMRVLFQRVKDVVYKVADGTAHLGIAGLDIVHEYPSEDLIIIHDKLGYGHCQLVVAVPEAWIDVQDIGDLREIAQDMRDQHNRNLRIATTFPHLTRSYFHSIHLHHFTIVRAEGAIEAAPTIGYADAVVDLTQSGTTLRENHLKTISGGTILDSQACLIGNRNALHRDPTLLANVRQMCEYIDACLSGKEFAQLTADIRGQSPEEIASVLAMNPATAGLIGPTISPVFAHNNGTQNFTVTLTVSKDNLLQAVDYLRNAGGIHVLITPLRYLFREQSQTFARLQNALRIDSSYGATRSSS